MSHVPPGDRRPAGSPSAYWERVARAYAGADPLAAVCYPGAPAWFNRFIAGLQWRTLTACLQRLPLAGATALDVGCGTGRWSRWLAEHGARVTGVDATEAMLDVARRAAPGIEFRRMPATALALSDASVDLVVCITVVQHLPPTDQLAAIAELCRVVRPGGSIVTLDLIDRLDTGAVVHPRPPDAWIEAYARHGAVLVQWTGQEYVPLLRLARWLGEHIPRRAHAPGAAAVAPGRSIWEGHAGGRLSRLTFGVLWVVVQLSRLMEPLCERVFPGRWARHGCFVFRKRSAAGL